MINVGINDYIIMVCLLYLGISKVIDVKKINVMMIRIIFENIIV